MATRAAVVVPPGWNEMLDNVLRALAQAEGEVDRSLQAFEAAVGESVEGTPVAEAGNESLQEPFRRLETTVAQADLLTGQTETALQESEAALRQWLALAEAIRRKLASPVVPSV